MNLNDVLNIIQSYSHVDIESEGKSIRKHLPTSELNSNLLSSYLSYHGKLTLIPKKMMGNAPMKLHEEALTIDKSSIIQSTGLGSIESSSRSTGNESELYRIMYENAKEEARDYKRKYEEALNEKHKAELELAGNKNSGLGEIAQGLAGFAPMLLGGGNNQGAAPLGNTTPTTNDAGYKKADPRLQNIIKRYAGLSEDEKDSIYGLLVKAFSNLDKVDEIISIIE